MKRTKVQSTSLKSVGYSPRKHTLEVEFTGGSVYQYHEVPAELHHALMGAESKGKFFATNIRDTYAFEVIKGRMKQPPRRPVGNWLMGDLSALTDYLRQENGGELPMASDLLTA